jgi:methionyl-tRNA formyltransferase
MNEMQLSKLRVIFMGTPEFAVPSLEALVREGCSIGAVVTAPDRPGGRGMKLRESAIKKYAIEKGLNILQPEKLKNPDFLETLKKLGADLQIVVAFRMLPEVVWNMPPLGTINLHGSLLPQYRGAAPINWAIINGEKETGVTTFRLQQAIDTGNILMQESFPIQENETAGGLHDRMKVIGAQVLIRTIKGLANGSLKEVPQNDDASATLHTAPKITSDTCKIDWARPAIAVHNLIRGLSPEPGAFTFLQGKLLKIFDSEMDRADPASKGPGEYETDKNTFLKFACANGYIFAKEIQLEGKKRMDIKDFLRGYQFD